VGAGSPKVSNNVPTLKPFHPISQKGLQSITNFEIFICFCYLLEMVFFNNVASLFLKVERHFFFWVVFALQLTFGKHLICKK